jgi:hypothetical protein
MIGQSENREQQPDYIYHTLLSQLQSFACCLLPALANCAKMLGQNHFAEPNRDVFDISSSNFNVHAHILSTIGDALPPNTFTIGKYVGLYQCLHYFK